MFHQFSYEARSHPELDRLPLHVRMKLDLSGVKLSLKDWLAFSLEERTAICHLPAQQPEEKEAFKSYLDFLCRRYRGAPAGVTTPLEPVWETMQEIPVAIAERTAGNGAAVGPDEWLRWTSFERYALYKTAISRSEPEKFFAVLAELRQPDRP